MKQQVHRRVMVNGAHWRTVTEQRTVYARKNGSQFVRDWQGQKQVYANDAGELQYDCHIVTFKRGESVA